MTNICNLKTFLTLKIQKESSLKSNTKKNRSGTTIKIKLFQLRKKFSKKNSE